MDRDKQICPMLTSQLHSFTKTQIVVPFADHYRAHPLLFLYQGFQFAGYGQHHGLFVGTALSLGTGILTSVTGVHRDDDLPQTSVCDRLDDLLSFVGAVLLGAIKIDHQPVTILPIGFQYETSRFHLLLEIQHHPQIPAFPLPAAQSADNRIVAAGCR